MEKRLVPANESQSCMVRVSNGTTNVHLGILDSSFVASGPKVGISHCNLVVTVRVLDAVDQMDDFAAQPDQFLAVVRLASSVPLQGLVSVNREAREVTRCGREEALALPLDQFVTAGCDAPHHRRWSEALLVTDAAHVRRLLADADDNTQDPELEWIRDG